LKVSTHIIPLEATRLETTALIQEKMDCGFTNLWRELLKTLLVVFLFVLVQSLESTEWIITPVGRLPSRCVHTVRNGAHIDESDEGEVKITNPDGGIQILPRDCPVRELLQRSKRQDYDGWLAFTTFHYPAGLDSFLGYFSVPNDPQNEPDVLYLFTGLQNVDWIPIVDPEPPIFDIIQPVLQYPGTINDWGVRSWYVTLDSGVINSDEIGVSAGDKIFGNMTRIQGSTWYIAGTSSQTSQTTSITVNKNRLISQPWAYNTAEGYGVNDCTNEPTNGCVFTQLQLFSKGKQVTPVWIPHKSPNPKCNEKATINSVSQVTITFQ